MGIADAVGREGSSVLMTPRSSSTQEKSRPTSAGGPSFWIGTTPETDYPALAGEIVVDVAVVGAGITGITTAALLKRAGKTVALLDLKRIVHGTTGYTTAKVTAGHGLGYSKIRKAFGEEGARTYAEANQAGLERIAEFVDEDAIDCDFERKDNYVYAEDEKQAEQVRQEVEVERAAGLPVSLQNETPLPYPVAAAVRLENQAQFHPRKYLLALAASIPGDGSHVFENSRVHSVKHAEPCTVIADQGAVRAQDVVIATHLPILDRGLFFARAFPHLSYALCAPIDETSAPDGMFLNAGTPTRSVRTMRDGDRLYLNVGGNGHKLGEADDAQAKYDELEQFLRRYWPDADEVAYRWSTHDYMPHDQVPYVGHLGRTTQHLYTATGFNKWGMTNGTAAAMMIADSILGRANPWLELFDAKRLPPKSALPRYLKENAIAGYHLVADRLRPGEKGSADEVRPGEGAIVGRLRKTAVYREDDGLLHELSPVCRHLWCIVDWNPAERTWDCPCHGSRYAADGRAIEGPTTKDLKRRS
jgi:glycine/D-amino acid oxidase-like deaminating enzyme/nitrite reductase/ring-hydroxylating ferredoxin subunit